MTEIDFRMGSVAFVDILGFKAVVNAAAIDAARRKDLSERLSIWNEHISLAPNGCLPTTHHTQHSHFSVLLPARLVHPH